jgi:hypothetical protein
VLEHRWFLSERAGFDVGMSEAIESYARDVLASALDEQRTLPPPLTQELPVIEAGDGSLEHPDR